MATKSRREKIRARRRKQQVRTWAIFGIFGVIVLGVVGFLIWNAVRPGVGEAMPMMANAREHIPNSQVPNYNSDPPTNGPHYGQPFSARFYEEADLTSLPPNPDGHLVHSLEHGYVIFWYNCTLLDEEACNTLKSQIRDVMNEFNNVKLIAFPRDSIGAPLVMTSWGRLQKFDEFDADLAGQFIRVNRNRAPEPGAP